MNALKMSGPRVRFCVVFLCLLLPPLSFADIGAAEEAIDVAGRQRMLTQRMLKNYALIGLGVRTRKSEDELEETMTLFNSQLNLLEQYISDDLSRERLRSVQALWAQVEPLYRKRPNREDLPGLRDQSEQLLKASHQLVLALQAFAQSQGGHLVNLAGRQRMLSQRMASLYALKAWGFEAAYDEPYQQAYREFERALAELIANGSNTPEIKRRLDGVERQFQRIQASAAAAGTGSYVPGLVERSAEKILESMNEITGMYVLLETR